MLDGEDGKKSLPGYTSQKCDLKHEEKVSGLQVRDEAASVLMAFEDAFVGGKSAMKCEASSVIR